MTSISGSSSSSALQAQKLLQQLLSDSQKTKKSNKGEGAEPVPAVIAAPPKQDAEKAFARLDVDGSGGVSKEELTNAVSKLDSNTKSALLSAQEKASAIDELFTKGDEDGDGSLSSAEFSKLADSVKPQGPPPGGGPPPPPPPKQSSDAGDSSDEIVAQIFDKLDTDKDGKISLAELSAAASADETEVSSTDADSNTVDGQLNQNISSFLKLVSGQANASVQQSSRISVKV